MGTELHLNADFKVSGDALFRNYKLIKQFISEKKKETNNRTEILDKLFLTARKEKRKNFDKQAVKYFADWGYKFESFDFEGDNELKSYAKKQKLLYCVSIYLLVPIMAVFFISIMAGPFIGPIIKSIQSSNSGDQTSENEKNCALKLVKYAWNDKDGCQKASFSSKSDCLWATIFKTYYYDQETYSYKKYYEYDVDEDLYAYNGAGVSKYSSDNIPANKMEFYITCSNDGNWYTNDINGNTTAALQYWLDNASMAINGK